MNEFTEFSMVCFVAAFTTACFKRIVRAPNVPRALRSGHACMMRFGNPSCLGKPCAVSMENPHACGCAAFVADGDLPEKSREIIGWRAWQVDELGARLRLKSVVVEAYWPWGEPIEARYIPPLGGGTHGAGVYAAKTRAGALKAMDDWPCQVYGTVALWGKVVEHDQGYRAQFAYPRHLWCRDQETAQSIHRLYGCEAEIASASRDDVHPASAGCQLWRHVS